MADVHETIPEGLGDDVNAALAWFNGTQDTEFEVTGIVDPDVSLAASDSRELHLVLCGGDLCQQKSFRVTRQILSVLRGVGPEVARIYVVDDCCPEGTADLVEADCSDPRVKVLRHERRRGRGS